jgi:hypothetical protein
MRAGAPSNLFAMAVKCRIATWTVSSLARWLSNTWERSVAVKQPVLVGPGFAIYSSAGRPGTVEHMQWIVEAAKAKNKECG